MNIEFPVFGRLQEKLRGPREASLKLQQVNDCISEHHDAHRQFLVKPTSEGVEKRSHQYQIRTSLAHKAKELGHQIDLLSESDRKQYVQSFCSETGFPNSQKTSEIIISHARDIISQSANSLGITIAYAGFSEQCSVGKRSALPGSDLDFLTILVRESDADIQELDKNIVLNLDPRLTDSSIATGISTIDDADRFVQHLAQNNNRTMYDQLYDKGWSEGKIYYASEMITNIRVGEDMINQLTTEEQERFAGVKDTVKENNRVEDIFCDNEKHRERSKLLKSFKKLSPDEQFVIIRILQIRSEAIALDITDDGPHANTLLSLQQKGLLTFEHDYLKAPWATYPWLFRNRNLFFYPDS